MSYGAHCVRMPPNCSPTAPPTGAPAENVANASERAREGGKAWARIPSYTVQYLSAVQTVCISK